MHSRLFTSTRAALYDNCLPRQRERERARERCRAFRRASTRSAENVGVLLCVERERWIHIGSFSDIPGTAVLNFQLRTCFDFLSTPGGMKTDVRLYVTYVVTAADVSLSTTVGRVSTAGRCAYIWTAVLSSGRVGRVSADVLYEVLNILSYIK